jgi:protein SCO1
MVLSYTGLLRGAPILALALCACASKPPPHLHGMQLESPQPAPTFTLTDQNGNAFSLAQARGQTVALYFGFTHCADVCPQTLALLGKARERAKLTPARMRIIMVSVDPRRDTPQALRAFFRKVGVQATGLTGSPAALAPVYRAYGISIEPQKHDIAHTDAIFVIDARGRMLETLAPEMPLKDVAADLRAVVE